jgi:restriction endonuclease S subunit
MTAFLKYPRYKPSSVEWLGEVPEHWDVERLKCSLSEIDVRSTTGTETLLSLRMNVGLVAHNDVSTLPITSAQLIGYKKVAPGQVVMNRMRASSGIFAVATSHGLVSPDYAVFEPKGKQGTDYLLSLFKTGSMMIEFRRYSTGLGTGESGFLRLYSNFFFNIRCPIPPKAEENRIVTFLDEKTAQIDTLIAKKQRQIELLDEQKAILINRAVTRGLDPHANLQDSGIEWIGPIPKKWSLKRMRYLCTIGTGECDTKDSVPDGKYPFFVRSQTPERINSFGFDCEAILTAGDGAGVGKVFHHFVGKFDCHQRVYVLRDSSEFKPMISSFMRSDPDVIFIGEVRDRESAELAIEAAITGHKVLTTIHTPRASQIIERFQQLGIERWKIAQTLKAACAQRLVKLLCQNCRVPCNGVSEREMRLFNLDKEWAGKKLYAHRKEGCDECGGRGYLGRAALLEILPITPRTGDALAKGDLTPYELELAIRKETSLPSLRDNGLRMLAEGKTDLDALRRVLDLTYLE